MQTSLLEHILKNYGFESAVFTALIFFIFARYFNIRDKKIELKHNLFQQLKVESINNFINCYSTSELCWIQLPYFDILNHKITGKDIDVLTIPSHNNLMASYYKLFVILDETEMKEFTKIYDSIQKIKDLLSQLIYDYKEKSLVVKTNKYYSLVSETSLSNRDLLKVIGTKFRAKYN